MSDGDLEVAVPSMAKNSSRRYVLARLTAEVATHRDAHRVELGHRFKSVGHLVDVNGLRDEFRRIDLHPV